MSYVCKFYGGSTGANFAKIWGRNISLTENLVNSYTLATYNPNWKNNDAYILTEFEDSLDAGNISSSIGTIQSWVLYRKEQTSDTLEFVDELSEDTISCFDFKILNDKIYQYYLFAKGSSEISSPIMTDVIQADYYGWFLIDVENNKSYQFDVEFDGGDKNIIEDYTMHQTNSKCNIFNTGGNKYTEGNINGILSVDNLKQDIQNTNDLMQELREFIQSDRLKLLKGRRSEIYNVIILEYQELVYNNLIGENVYKVSFKFKEVGDV